MEDLIIARYLFDQRPDGRYVPKVSVQLPGPDRRTESHLISDPQGRNYRDLNRGLKVDFCLLNRWRMKHAPRLQFVIRIDVTPPNPAEGVSSLHPSAHGFQGFAIMSVETRSVRLVSNPQASKPAPASLPLTPLTL